MPVRQGKASYVKLFLWALSYTRQQMAALVAFILAGLVATLVELSIPKAIQYFVDDIIPARSMTQLMWVMAALAAAVIVMFGLTAYRNYLQRLIQENATRRLQSALFNHLRHLGMAYYEMKPIGETLSLFQLEVANIRRLYSEYLPKVIRDFLLLLVSFGFLIQIHWQMAVSLLPCFLVYYAVGPYFERRAVAHGMEARDHQVTYNRQLYDTVSGWVELRLNGREQWKRTKDLEQLAKAQQSTRAHFLFADIRTAFRYISVYLGVVVLFFYGIQLVRQDSLSIGQFVAFSFYCFIMLNNMTSFIRLITEQRFLLLKAERLYRFFQTKPVIAESASPVVLQEVRGEIHFHRVSFYYVPEYKTLHELSFQIAAGEKVAFVGESGSGKTTILKLISRMYDPQEGRITLDGVPLASLSLSQLRDAIGYVFQDTYLFNASIRDNIRFGQPDATEQEIVEAAKAAYAHDFISAMQEGYDTLVGERGIKLSGGQKQRISLARMFIKNPRIVVLDEATASLDNVSEVEVQRALERLLKGRTTIAVAHRLTTIENFDRILYVEDGRIVEAGSYDELMSRNGWLNQLAASGQGGGRT